MTHYYFPCFNLTYVTSDYHDSIILVKDAGRNYKPQTPVTLQFENIFKKAKQVTITYEDGSKYYGEVAMDSFYGFLRHGDGKLFDGENLLLSSGRYYQNEWIPKYDVQHCHNDNLQVHCINKDDDYGFGSLTGSISILPTICERCVKDHCDSSVHFLNMRYSQIAYFAGVNTKKNDELIGQLLAMFANAYGSTHNDVVVVHDSFYNSPWKRSTMFHNLFNRKTIRDRVIADFKAIVKIHKSI